MSEEYPYKYDVIVKMTIRTKEDLPEKDIIASVDVALWGTKLSMLTGAWVSDLDVEGKKRQEDKDVSI